MAQGSTQAPGVSAGVLREGLIEAMDLGGAYGKNLADTKPVLVRVGDTHYAVDHLGVNFVAGSFAFVITAGEEF